MLLKHGEEQELQVYFQFNEEEYSVIVEAKEYRFRYGLIPCKEQVDKWYNVIITTLYDALEDKVRKM